MGTLSLPGNVGKNCNWQLMNAKRKQAKSAEGEKRYKLEHRKSKQDWTIRPIYEAKDNSFVMDMLSDVVERRKSETKPMGRVRASEPPVNIAAKES